MRNFAKSAASEKYSDIKIQELNDIKKPLVESLLNLADLVDRINGEIKKLNNEYTR